MQYEEKCLLSQQIPTICVCIHILCFPSGFISRPTPLCVPRACFPSPFQGLLFILFAFFYVLSNDEVKSSFC